MWKLSPPASPGGEWTEGILYSFPSVSVTDTEGSAPDRGVIFDKAGALYGIGSHPEEKTRQSAQPEKLLRPISQVDDVGSTIPIRRD